MQVPYIHHNGTGLTGLLKQTTNACLALRQALAIMGKATPHMRDYYVLKNAEESFSLALKEHDARVASVDAVLTEYERLADAILRAGT